MGAEPIIPYKIVCSERFKDWTIRRKKVGEYRFDCK
jgi:hypothetical protein